MGLRGPKPKRREIIWTPEFAYGVGLMTTDGNLSKDKRHLSLVSKDKQQIDNLRNCFGIRAAAQEFTYVKRNQTYYRVQWGDVTLYNYFLHIGLRPNKSLVLESVDIPEKLYFDFLRGCFDGDGSFYSYYDPRWKTSFMYYLVFTSASSKHLKWLQCVNKRLVNVNGHISKRLPDHYRKGFYQLRYAKKECDQLLRKMYSQDHLVCLSRKRLKIEAAMRIVGKSLVSQSDSQAQVA